MQNKIVFLWQEVYDKINVVRQDELWGKRSPAKREKERRGVMSKIKLGRGATKLSYKYIISICIMSLLFSFVIAFTVYAYYGYKKKSVAIVSKEIEYTASRIVNQVDERLDNLRQYYLIQVNEDECQWFLSSQMNYSDYAAYKELNQKIKDNSLFGDYVSGYTLVNFENEWIISSKGIYSLDDTVNRTTLNDLYELNVDGSDNWYYNPYITNVRTSDRTYRLTVDTGGLNLLIKLPLSAVYTKGMLLVNVNLATWENWIAQSLNNSYEKIVVLDEDENVIYSTSEELQEQCVTLLRNDDGEMAVREVYADGCPYLVAAEKSDVLGWNYYVCYNLQQGQLAGVRFILIVLSVLLLVAIVSYIIVSYFMYQPVKNLVKSISQTNRKIDGNEFEFLAGEFADLKNDRDTMGLLLQQNHEKLREMFELRLLRGEVRSEDEWQEYSKTLNLEQHRYYASVVMVLNLRDEEQENASEEQGNINEDAICLKLVENLPEKLKKILWMPLIYNTCAMFGLFADDDEEALLKKINLFYDEIQKYVDESCGYRILMGVSATHTDRKHISAAYRESINALTMESGGTGQEKQGESELVDREDCHFYLASVAAHADKYNNSYERSIQSAISNLDKEQCYKVIDEFTTYLGGISSCDEALVYVIRMIDAILLAAINTKVNLEQLYPEGVSKLYRRITEVNEPARVRRSLKCMLIDPILAARKKLLEDNSYSFMEEIEKKIQESKGNISLTECADALGVNTTYIWKVLKMERGKTFSEYQEEYKLEEAKRLLLQTSMSVAEIAAELNYTNAQNFIRFFSKGTGVTPGKFRKLY